MSNAVLADAQFSVARVFRPFPGFETVYQGQSPRVPIAFPGTLDPDAHVQPGFDPNLIAGIPVPFGSKVMLWIPTIYHLTGEGDPPELSVVPYRFQVSWRLRNIRDYRERRGRSAYHFPRQSMGANNQFVVPAAQKVIVYEGPQTTVLEGPDGSQFKNVPEVYATQSAVLERITFPSITPMAPLSPAGGGAIASYQQGVADLTGVNFNQTLAFNSVQLDAEGDEMLITVDRDSAGFTGDWDFSGENSVDFGMSLFFGNGSGSIIRDLGIYVFTGSNP